MHETSSSLLRRVSDPADAESWREFVALYEPLLRAFARRRGLAADEAADVAQEVLGRLVLELRRFRLDRARGRFRTWLWRVTCNALIDHDRRRRRRARAEEGWARAADRRAPDDAAASESEWLRLHRSRILAFALERVRAQTQPRTWACFERHILRGHASAAVAAELGITPNAVNINSSRVQRRLRDFCAGYLEDLADEPDALPGRP